MEAHHHGGEDTQQAMSNKGLARARPPGRMWVYFFLWMPSQNGT